MTFADLKYKTLRYREAVMLEPFIPHSSRVFFKKLFFVMSVVLLVLSTGTIVVANTELYSFTFLIVTIFLVLMAVDAMYYSFALSPQAFQDNLFELALLVRATGSRDAIGSFIRSHLGGMILLRAGVDRETQYAYTQKRIVLVRTSAIAFPPVSSAFESYIRGLYRAEASFTHLLTAHGLSEDDFVECSLIAVAFERLSLRRERFWSARRLEYIAAATLIEQIHTYLHDFERQTGFLFTHGALSSIDIPSPDEPREFLEEYLQELFTHSVEQALSAGRALVYREDVESF